MKNRLGESLVQIDVAMLPLERTDRKARQFPGFEFANRHQLHWIDCAAPSQESAKRFVSNDRGTAAFCHVRNIQKMFLMPVSRTDDRRMRKIFQPEPLHAAVAAI